MTHLVEHLALPAQSRHRLSFSAGVDNAVTSFWARGPESEVGGLLARTATALVALPLERLATERRSCSPRRRQKASNPNRLAFALRFGPVGHGLVGYDEWGLRRLAGDELKAWADARFTRGNAAVWLTGPEPGAFELDLPPGEQHLPPEPWTIPRSSRLSGLALRGEHAGRDRALLRGGALHGAPDGLEHPSHWIQDRLRYELGLGYDVGGASSPLTEGRVARRGRLRRVGADRPARRGRDARGVRALAAEGPSSEELEHERRRPSRQLRRSGGAALVPGLHRLAAPARGAEPRDRVVPGRAGADDVTPDVAAAIESARSSLLAIAPEKVESRLEGSPPTRSPRRGRSSRGAASGRRGLRMRRSATDPSSSSATEGVIEDRRRLPHHRGVRRCALVDPVPGRVAHADQRRRLLRAGGSGGLAARQGGGGC